MSEKKNIDRLFQEKFKDFEASPPEFVWDNIREKLEDKKKRRVIPFWFKLSGVAAILIMGLLLGGFYFNAINTDNNNPVVLDNQKANQGNPLPGTPIGPPTQNNTKNGSFNNDLKVNSGLVTNEQDGANGNPNSSPDNGKSGNSTSGSANAESAFGKGSSASGTKNNAVVNNNSKANRPGNSNSNKRSVISQSDNAVVSTSNSKFGKNSRTGKAQKGQNIDAEMTINGTRTRNNNAVAVSQNKTSNTNGANSTSNNNNALASSKNNKSGKTNTAANGIIGQNLNSGLTINGTASAKNNNTVVSSQNETGTANIRSIEGSIVGNAVGTAASGVIDASVPLNEQAVAEVAIDTVAVPENELEKLLREKTEGKKEDKDKAIAKTDVKDKWSVKPQLAPVFYNSLSKGSPIDGQFAGNAKSYDNDLSVGLGVNYAVTSRLKVRSGINTVNLNYSTQDVQFYASLEGQTRNVAARSSNANIVVQDQKNNVVDPSLLFANNSSGDKYNGAMLQKTGYVEVPVEMSYALINNKFGIDLIGGVSTLFLNQNNVSVVSEQGLSTNVGQAQNLNNIHFSTNVGVGFKYRFFKAFEAHFEPMFKYQVNTFSRDAGNFKPYFIGLYSGVSFSF